MKIQCVWSWGFDLKVGYYMLEAEFFFQSKCKGFKFFLTVIVPGSRSHLNISMLQIIKQTWYT